MRRSFWGLAALATAGALSIGNAQAGLAGDSISARYFFPDGVTLFQDAGIAPAPSTFGFVFLDGSLLSATVTNSQIIVTFDNHGFTPAPFNGLSISDVTNSPITNATIDAASTVVGFTQSDIIVTPQMIALNLSGLETSLGQDLIVDVATSEPRAVPEPATLALFATGLVGLGALRRRASICG